MAKPGLLTYFARRLDDTTLRVSAMYSQMTETALRIAATAHADQHRKGSETPYITHPVQVARILEQSGFNEEHLIAAALLHDVVEDTDVTHEQLSEHFSESVLDIVSALTERKRDASGNPRPWEDRKADHLKAIASASLEAKAVFLADKLHNLATLADDLQAHGPETWGRFNAPRERLLWYYRAGLEAAETDDERIQCLISECQWLIDQIEATD